MDFRYVGLYQAVAGTKDLLIVCCGYHVCIVISSEQWQGKEGPSGGL